MTEKASIFVTFQQVGFHRWPDATSERAYLAALHRHSFHVHVETAVDHDHSEIVFHDLLDEARSRFAALRAAGDWPRLNLGPQSCETLARRLGAQLADLYQRPFTVMVSEDGECGATVRTAPEQSA